MPDNTWYHFFVLKFIKFKFNFLNTIPEKEVQPILKSKPSLDFLWFAMKLNCGSRLPIIILDSEVVMFVP